MAGRIRSIKPELLDLEAGSQLSDRAWRVWIGMWLLADDHGNLQAGERLLAAAIYQDTSKTTEVQEALTELAQLPAECRVQLYRVGSQTYAHIGGWSGEACPAVSQYLPKPGKARVPKPGDPGTVNVDSGTYAPVLQKSPKVSGDSRRTSETFPPVRAGVARADLRSPISDLDHEPRSAAASDLGTSELPRATRAPVEPEPTDDLEASTVEPLDADDPPVYHPVQLANFASYGIPLTVPGETKAQGQARRRAALAAALEADLGPNPGSSGQGVDEGEEDPDPPSGRPSLDGHAPALHSPQDAPTPPATASRPSTAPPAPASALPAAPGHVAVEGEVWPPPPGWIPGPESVLRTCGSCSHGRRFPEPLLCPCPLGEHAARIRAQRELEAAEEARELAREQKRRAKKLDAPPLFGPETPAEQAAANAPDTTPLGKLGMAALLPPPGYGAKVPDDPAALILATLERQPEPLRHLADPGMCSRLAGAVMGTKATVAQIEDAIRMASSKLPAELGNVRADDPRGLDRVQRWIAGCLKGCRNQGPGRAAPHDPSEALPIVTRRILTRFAAAYREQEGIDYLAGEEDPAHAEVIAGHLKRQVEAAAQRAGTAPDAALGGAMLAQLIETWMGSKLGEATGHALAQLASALRREPARWVYRPTAPDPYAGVTLGPAPTHAPGFRHPMPPTVLKPRADLDNVVDLFAKKRVSG